MRIGILIICFSIFAFPCFTDNIIDILKAKDKEITEIKSELITAQHEKKRWQIVNVIYNHYKKSGTLKSYHTPGLFYDIVCYGEKYRYLGRKFNYDTVDPTIFFLCWIANESSFNPREDCIYRKNANQSVDLWIMQMNECHYKGKNNLWKRIERVNPELSHKADWAVEKNIAIWYMWMGEQKGYPVWRVVEKWQKTRPDVMKLFDELKAVV